MKKELLNYITRNLARKKKQTFFSILCIMVSSMIILFNISLNNGIQHKLKEGVNNAISGQITIYNINNSKLNILEAQLKEQIPFEWSIKEQNKIIREIQNIHINKRIRFGSLISFKDETSYVNIHSLEDDHLLKINNLINIKEGTLPDKSSILISETTAKDLKVQIGDTVLLVANNLNDYMSDEIAKVSGIFEEKGLAIYLGYSAFVHYELGGNIVQLPTDECLELIVNSSDGLDLTDNHYKKIVSEFNAINSELKIAPWDKTVPLFFTVANIWKASGAYIQIIFIAFSLIILVNLISLIINSRKKEIGTLLAFGFSWTKITFMLCIEYLLIVIISIIISYTLLSIFIQLLPHGSIIIQSKDMQAALMTDILPLILYVKNIIYVSFLFCTSIIVAVFISILKLKRKNPILLLNGK